VNVKTTFLVSVAVLVLSMQAMGQGAQSLKIGFVISPKIFQELPEAQDAQKRLEAIAKPVQDSIAMYRQEIQRFLEEYQSKEAMMTDVAKRQAQQEFQELQRRASDYAETRDRDLARQQEQLLAPLREKVKKAIENVAKEERYSFVFDKNEQIDFLLYGDPAHDLTFKVIDRLKRGR
jgi:outer membrane protein